MYHSGGFIVTVYGLVGSGQYCGVPGGLWGAGGGVGGGWGGSPGDGVVYVMAGSRGWTYMDRNWHIRW
jgi:hypothetical protein